MDLTRPHALALGWEWSSRVHTRGLVLFGIILHRRSPAMIFDDRSDCRALKCSMRRPWWKLQMVRKSHRKRPKWVVTGLGSGVPQFFGQLLKTLWNLYQMLPNSPELLPTTQATKAPYSWGLIQAKTTRFAFDFWLNPRPQGPYLYPILTKFLTIQKLSWSLRF